MAATIYIPLLIEGEKYTFSETWTFCISDICRRTSNYSWEWTIRKYSKTMGWLSHKWPLSCTQRILLMIRKLLPSCQARWLKTVRYHDVAAFQWKPNFHSNVRRLALSTWQATFGRGYSKLRIPETLFGFMQNGQGLHACKNILTAIFYRPVHRGPTRVPI